jgi:DNA-binding IclR family transcriptional regulator
MFRDRPSVRIVDAAQELEAAPSTVHRLLAMLVAHGFVTRDLETQAYVPGEVLVDLGVQVINQWDFVEIARPFLADLVGRTRETASMGVLRRTDALFVLELESDQLVRIGNQLGQRIPAFHSSIGRVLLAELDPARVRELFPDKQLRNPASDVVVARADLEADLELIRQRGYATNDQPRALDFSSIAIPLRRRGRAVAAIAVAAPSPRVDEGWKDRMLPELQSAAKSIEAVLT